VLKSEQANERRYGERMGSAQHLQLCTVRSRHQPPPLRRTRRVGSSSKGHALLNDYRGFTLCAAMCFALVTHKLYHGLSAKNEIHHIESPRAAVRFGKFVSLGVSPAPVVLDSSKRRPSKGYP
jgi:hypothetical protein